MSQTSETGSAGEAKAATWLAEEGFEIVARNWRHGRYEIDIVARRNGCVHFVEVKTRRAGGLTTPEEAMTPGKASALLLAAGHYITDNHLECECFIDLIAVDMSPDGSSTVRYIPGAVNTAW